MMSSGPPVFYDPSHINLNMSNAPPPSKKSRLFDVAKIIVGILIVLLLGAILILLIFIPNRSTNTIDLRGSNEYIARLQRESNENIARLEREHELSMDRERFRAQKNLTDQYRLLDRLFQLQIHEQQISAFLNQSKQRFDLEEKHLEILRTEKQLNEQHREEDLTRENDDLLDKLLQEIIINQPPLTTATLELKIHSVIRRFDDFHKSLLIRSLYKLNLLRVTNSKYPDLNLREIDLKNLNLNKIESNSINQLASRLNYTELALPMTVLINSSFENILVNHANFSMSNLMGASFRGSEIALTDFSDTDLSRANFHDTYLLKSNFFRANIQNATFKNVILSEADMISTNCRGSHFQSVTATETKFIQADLSYTNFQEANLAQARMDYATVYSSTFYFATAHQANFDYASMASTSFVWSVLRNASFRSAFLAGANFENADVQDVDFTRAFMADANITLGQLNVALSIAHAVLPDGSIGKNKNLVSNGHAQCTGENEAIIGWIISENIFTSNKNSSITDDCVFQSRVINATLRQIIDVTRYERLINYGTSNIYLEMQAQSMEDISSSLVPAYMTIIFFNSTQNQIGSEQSTLTNYQFTPPTTYISQIPCPLNTARFLLSVFFTQVNSTVDNIYVTID